VFSRVVGRCEYFTYQRVAAKYPAQMKRYVFSEQCD